MMLPVLRGPNRTQLPPSPSTNSIALPPVFVHSLQVRKALISIEDASALRKELSKKVTFVKQGEEKLLSGVT